MATTKFKQHKPNVFEKFTISFFKSNAHTAIRKKVNMKMNIVYIMFNQHFLSQKKDASSMYKTNNIEFEEIYNCYSLTNNYRFTVQIYMKNLNKTFLI